MASTISFGDGNSGLEAGVINGPVSTTFHHHAAPVPERAETSPKPTAIIPFSRDKDFVRRGTILDQVHQLHTDATSRVALVGLGGVGKSQVAIEYAYQVREKSPETWVFWVHASNEARYRQSFLVIADLVEIPGRKDPQSDIFQLVNNWLRSGKSGQWIVILDNVDRIGSRLDAPQARQDERSSDVNGLNFPPVPSSLIKDLPYGPHGSILITSRNRDVALQLVEEYNIVSVEPMSQVNAVALIEKKLGKLSTPEDGESVEALAAALERMPLAIVQVTSYIARKASRCSLQKYLEKFEQSDHKKTSLLDFEGGRLRRDQEAKNSIFLTWQIAFDHIRETRSSATDLLSLMSFCDRQGIPESLLRRLGDEGEDNNSEEGLDGDQVSTKDEAGCSDSGSSSTGDEAFEEDISILRDYAFISMNNGGKTFEMHRLVQLATRKWLKEQGQQERWKGEFIRCVRDELPPSGRYEYWTEWQALLPQVRSAAAHRPKKNEASLRNWASVLYKTAWYFLKLGFGVSS